MLANRDVLDLRVTRRSVEPGNVVSLVLEDRDGAPLPDASAGAHIDLLLPNGLTRSYSLLRPVGREHSTVYEIGVLRAKGSRGGSAAVHDQLHVDAVVRSSPPRNLFPLQKSAYTVLVAGGIGITPILAMAEELTASGAEFELHYCIRSLETAAFLKRLETTICKDRVHIHVSEMQPPTRLDASAVVRSASRSGVNIYTCGPHGLIHAMSEAALAGGLTSAQINAERFLAPDAVSHSKEKRHAFSIVLAKSGALVSVQEDESAAHALIRSGVPLPVSCEQGVCGTCMVRLVDGEADHRDFYLTPDERLLGSQFLPCCSRAHSASITLDL